MSQIGQMRVDAHLLRNDAQQLQRALDDLEVAVERPADVEHRLRTLTKRMELIADPAGVKP